MLMSTSEISLFMSSKKYDYNDNQASMKVTLDKKPLSWIGPKISEAKNVLSLPKIGSYKDHCFKSPHFPSQDCSTFSALLISWSQELGKTVSVVNLASLNSSSIMCKARC